MRMNDEGACDVCGGVGKLLDDQPCLCGGSGLASDAVVELRRLLGEEERRADTEKAAREKAELRASILRKSLEGVVASNHGYNPGYWIACDALSRDRELQLEEKIP